MSSSLLSSFLGALQASLSVLLVISYGVLATQFDLLDKASAKKISTVCVRLFLPALLITKVGKELEISNVLSYVAILGMSTLLLFGLWLTRQVWAIAYNLTSIGVGALVVKVFRLPSWVIPAISFNNTTSLPLLLVQSLESTGILQSLIRDGDSVSDAISRAQSFFLVNAIVGNCLTFAVGPRLIDAEHAPDDTGKDKEENDDQQQNGHASSSMGEPTEQTSLLPDRMRSAEEAFEDRAHASGMRHWERLSSRTRNALSFAYDFFNSSTIGAIIGAIIGLVQPLHKLFFNDTDDGGYLNAWLTQSLQNTGQLFVTLQVIVVGVSLASALRKMKRGEDSGSVPWPATVFVFLVRFVLWPAISISTIYGIALNTNWLDADPILWFAMMLMPTGPPAMKLVAMVDVNGADETEKMIISKLLVICYALSPFLAVTVVGALSASEAASSTGK